MQALAPQAGRFSDPAQGQTETLPYRRPFGGESSADEGFDWRNLAASAAGAAGLAAILGSARFGGRFDQNAKLYREFIRNVSREGAPAVPASTGGEWVKRLLGGSWWHGTPATDTVLEKGFAPEYEKMGLRFGEPSGVSVSASPRTAATFGRDGSNVLRVWPKVDPKSVLPVWADEAHEPIIKAYMQALEHRPNLNDPKTIRDYLADLNSGGWGLRYAANEISGRHPAVARQFNQRLSEELEKQGIQGLLYNPHRYGEYEMRVLDPRKAVPIEERLFGDLPSRWDAEYEEAKRLSPMSRFSDLKQKRVIAPYDNTIPSTMNKSLSEHYAQIPESQVLGSPRAISLAEQDWAKKMYAIDTPGLTTEADKWLWVADAADLAKHVPEAKGAKQYALMQAKAAKGPKNVGQDWAQKMIPKPDQLTEMDYAAQYVTPKPATTHAEVKWPGNIQDAFDELPELKKIVNGMAPPPFQNMSVGGKSQKDIEKMVNWWDSVSDTSDAAGANDALFNKVSKIANELWQAKFTAPDVPATKAAQSAKPKVPTSGPDSYGTGNAPTPTFQGASPNMTIQAKIDLAAAHVNKNMTPNSGEWWYEVGKLLNEKGEMEAAHAAYAVASQKGAKPW